MQVWSFASGSDGNCYLVESERTHLLVECGRPQQQIEACLEAVGLQPAALQGILLTHAHGDHSRSARSLAETHRVPVYASGGTLAAIRLEDSSLGRPLISDRTVSIGQLDVTPFAVPHDCYEPLGFRFEGGTGRATIATDLGWVPPSVGRRFRDTDLLVLEANYDPHLLQTGRYPEFLKRRVGGRRGHLSNGDAGTAIANCGDRAPRAVWLAHLSEHNNSPKHALETVSGLLAQRGLGHVPVQTTRHRHSRLHWTSSIPRERQLALF